MSKLLLLILPLLPLCVSCTPSADYGTHVKPASDETACNNACAKQADITDGNGNDYRKYLPVTLNDAPVVNHYAYSLEYSEADEQPRWVAYMLCRNRLDGPYSRKSTKGAVFHEDPAIPSGSAAPDDYRQSGFSRGHLAPAADMKWDSLAQVECFFFSNMSPMEQSFNGGVWNRLELQIRRWAEWYDTIYVVTGPLLGDGGSDKIGVNGVTVPKAFFKAVYCPSLRQAVGFLVPHIQDKAQLTVFAMSIDELEQKTQIDFFHGIEDEIEATYTERNWNFNKK